MTKSEFKEAVALAIAPDRPELKLEDIAIFEGCAYPSFQPVYVTKLQVSLLLRWQARQMNGQWDAEELNSCAYIARKRFLIIG